MRPYHFSLTLLALCVAAAPARAQTNADAPLSRFQRGFYWQSHENDPARAAKEFEAVVSDPEATDELRREARIRLDQCREELSAADLARLMPADALAYFEIQRPGKHLAELARMLGLSASGAARKNGGDRTAAIPLEAGFVLPHDFSVSPALLAELTKIRGAAVAVTSIDGRGQPHGVAIVHPGESDLLRGLTETGVQVLPPSESIGDFPTYVMHNQAWIVRTARLLIVASSKSQASAAVARLKSSAGESLAQQAEFKELAADRSRSLAFAFVSGPRLLPNLAAHVRLDELAIARGVLDLDHLQSASIGVRVADERIEASAKVRLAAGHQNLAYALVRTAPATRRSLAHVPSGVAAVALIGLNPAGPPDAKRAEQGETPRITAMDLGREVFSNIEEVSLFVLPMSGGPGGRSGGPAIPDVGLVFAVKDASQSAALWNQLLALPARFGLPLTQGPEAIRIEGKSGKQYSFPFTPPIVVVEHDRLLVAGTQGAVTAALRCGTVSAPIAKDPSLAALVQALPADASKAIFVDAARAMRLAGAIGGRDGRELAEAAPLVDGLIVAAATGESPTQLIVRAEATGLPNVLKLAATLARPRPATAAPPRKTPSRIK